MQGLSYRQASARAGCATTTLFKHKHERVKHTSIGRSTALTPLEEKVIALEVLAIHQLVTWLAVSSGNTLTTLASKIHFLVASQARNGGIVFHKWPSLYKTEHLTIQHANAGSNKVVDKLFSNLEKILQDEGLLTLP